MAGTLAPTEKCLEYNIAVCLKDPVFVLTTSTTFSSGTTVVDKTIILWIYDIWTEQWAKHTISERKCLPFVSHVHYTGVVIGTYVHIMCGLIGEHFKKNMLWNLRLNANRSCAWGLMHIDKQAQVPSPRIRHCAWAHGEKMWVFGGWGPSPVNYLNDYGDFELCEGSYGTNNQLLSFHPPTKTWTNAKCFGDIPSPLRMASSAMVADTVWLYGGLTKNDAYNNDMYELSMLSFAWTKIEVTTPRPNGNYGASLSPISASQFLLHGGQHQDEHGQSLNTMPWIFSVQLRTWRQHPTAESHLRENHTCYCITALNSNIIILGGKTSSGSRHQRENTILCVRLEPKSLQQLAIQMIYKHKSELPWKSLPKKMTCKIMGPK